MQGPAKRSIINMDTETQSKQKIVLPSDHQIGDNVWLNLWGHSSTAEVNAVHFYANKVKYDLKVFARTKTIRLYNIEAEHISKTI